MIALSVFPLGFLGAKNPREDFGERRPIFSWSEGQISRGELAELRETSLGGSDDDDLPAHFHEINRTPCIERKMTDEIDRTTRASNPQATRPVEHGKRQRTHGKQRDERLDNVPRVRPHVGVTIGEGPRAVNPSLPPMTSEDSATVPRPEAMFDAPGEGT